MPCVRIQISDLISRPGQTRTHQHRVPVQVSFPTAQVDTVVSFDAAISGVPDGVWLRGSVEAEAELTCNRCLTRWTQTIYTPVERLYRLQPSDPEEELVIEDGGWIDVTQPVHEQISLALPFNSVCSPDCLGICPECGTDLNQSICSGHQQDAGSPFAALADLLETSR